MMLIYRLFKYLVSSFLLTSLAAQAITRVHATNNTTESITIRQVRSGSQTTKETIIEPGNSEFLFFILQRQRGMARLEFSPGKSAEIFVINHQRKPTYQINLSPMAEKNIETEVVWNLKTKLLEIMFSDLAQKT